MIPGLEVGSIGREREHRERSRNILPTSLYPIPTTMPLQGEVYLVGNTAAIRRLESRGTGNGNPGIGFREIDLVGLVGTMERADGERDALEGVGNSDALFLFAIRAFLDQQSRPSRLGDDRVWRRLVAMGLEAGEMPGSAGRSVGSMQAVRYAAVIANQLMRRQEGLEHRVRRWDE